MTHHVFLQVGSTREGETAGCAVEVSFPLVMHSTSVVLEGALVAEGRGTDVTMEYMPGMSCQDVSG